MTRLGLAFAAGLNLSCSTGTEDGTNGTDAELTDDCDTPPWPDLPGWSEFGVDYTECPGSEPFFGGDCAGDACADSPEAVELLEAFRRVIEARGYADRIEIVSASHDDSDGLEAYALAYVVVVDWWRCPAAVAADGPQGSLDTLVEQQVPDRLPDSIPSWREVVERMRACDPESQPAPCRTAAPVCNRIEGTAGECGEVIVWWSNAAGAPPMSCEAISGEACCATVL